MKASVVIVAFSIVLMAGPSNAQTPAGQAPPKPTTPAPTTPAQPAPTSPTQPAAQPKPFPEGAKIAYVNVQRIAEQSGEGKAATSRITALRQQKEKELQEKNKAFEAARTKLETSGSVLSESARSTQQKEVERLQVDLQRATQDAQREIQELQNELQRSFEAKLLPLIGEVAASRNLHMVFSAGDSGLVWADTGLDITPDIIKRLDGAASAPAAPAKK
jgi:outer membrane protein